MDMYEEPEEFDRNPVERSLFPGPPFPVFGNVYARKVNLLDRIFGNCEKGVHKFKEFLLKKIPPKKLDFVEARGNVSAMLDSLAEFHYEIRCERCGRKPQY